MYKDSRFSTALSGAALSNTVRMHKRILHPLIITADGVDELASTGTKDERDEYVSLIVDDIRNAGSLCMTLLTRPYMYGHGMEFYDGIHEALLTLIVTLLRDDHGFSDDELGSVVILMDDARQSRDIRVTAAMGKIANALSLGNVGTRITEADGTPLPLMCTSRNGNYAYQLDMKAKAVVAPPREKAAPVAAMLRGRFPEDEAKFVLSVGDAAERRVCQELFKMYRIQNFIILYEYLRDCPLFDFRPTFTDRVGDWSAILDAAYEFVVNVYLAFRADMGVVMGVGGLSGVTLQAIEMLVLSTDVAEMDAKTARSMIVTPMLTYQIACLVRATTGLSAAEQECVAEVMVMTCLEDINGEDKRRATISRVDYSYREWDRNSDEFSRVQRADKWNLVWLAYTENRHAANAWPERDALVARADRRQAMVARAYVLICEMWCATKERDLFFLSGVRGELRDITNALRDGKI